MSRSLDHMWVSGLLLLTFLSLTVGVSCTSNQSGAGADASRQAMERAPEWIRIKAGSFKMGSPPREQGRLSIEVLHEVTLTRGFLIQSTEVTQGQFLKLMGYNPSRYTDCGRDCPVEDLNWHEAAAYANALSKQEDLEMCYACRNEKRDVKCQRNARHGTPYECSGYRLPTEAEWEYAARAGEDRATSNGNMSKRQLECQSPHPILDPIAWFCGNSGRTTHPVAQKRPNEWGLYDMLGNVWEWNHDWDSTLTAEPVTDPWGPLTGRARVGHGGSFINKARLVRFAARGGGDPDEAYGFLGVRLVRTAPEE